MRHARSLAATLFLLTAVGATTGTEVVILSPIAYSILETIAFSL